MRLRFLMASVILHGLALGALWAAARPAPEAAPPALDVTLVPGPPPAPEAPGPPGDAEPRGPQRPRAAPAARALERPRPGRPVGTATGAAPVLDPRAATPGAGPPPARGLDLGLQGLPAGVAAAPGAGAGDPAGGSGSGAGAGAGDPLTGRLPPPPRGEAWPLRRDGHGGLVYRDDRFTARVAPDGSVRFEDRHGSFDPRTLSFGCDLNDEIMRLRGEDPYAYEKRKFLAAAWERRLRMRARADQRHLAAALKELPQRLATIWRDSRRPPAERRRLLFLLWEECDPATAAGRAARSVIEGFVRRELPRGSAAAFTDEELRRLARLTRPAFDPYGAGP